MLRGISVRGASPVIVALLHRALFGLICAGIMISFPAISHAASITFDNHDPEDGKAIGTSFAADFGATFTNAVFADTSSSGALCCGFPAFSGDWVAFDYSNAFPDPSLPEWMGPMRVDFASPVSEVSGRFTYDDGGLIIRAFSSLNVELAVVSRPANANNLSTPHELLTLSNSLGLISYVTFESESAGGLGGQFLLDDLDFSSAQTTPTPVPEPGTLILLGSAGVLLVRKRLRGRQRDAC